MALDDTNKKILVERIRALPAELQALILEGELEAFAEKQADEFKLSEEQKARLSDEVLFTLLALESLVELPKNLVTNVSLNALDAKKILQNLIDSPLEVLAVAAVRVFAKSEDESAKIAALVFGNGINKSQQDFINEEMVKKYQIPEEKQGRFIEVIEDVVLGFNKIADLPRLFQQKVGLEKETTHKLVGDLIDGWELIVIREEEEATAKREEAISLADKIAAIKPTEKNSGFKDSEIAPTTVTSTQPITPQVPATPATTPSAEQTATPTPEPVPNTEPVAVKPIRTMGTDVQKVHGYGALPQSQSPDTETDEPTIQATPQDEIKKPVGF